VLRPRGRRRQRQRGGAREEGLRGVWETNQPNASAKHRRLICQCHKRPRRKPPRRAVKHPVHPYKRATRGYGKCERFRPGRTRTVAGGAPEVVHGRRGEAGVRGHRRAQQRTLRERGKAVRLRRGGVIWGHVLVRLYRVIPVGGHTVSMSVGVITLLYKGPYKAVKGRIRPYKARRTVGSGAGHRCHRPHTRAWRAHGRAASHRHLRLLRLRLRLLRLRLRLRQDRAIIL
jgi:hypothetical protein